LFRRRMEDRQSLRHFDARPLGGAHATRAGPEPPSSAEQAADRRVLAQVLPNHLRLQTPVRELGHPTDAQKVCGQRVHRPVPRIRLSAVHAGPCDNTCVHMLGSWVSPFLQRIDIQPEHSRRGTYVAEPAATGRFN
jgi:hypothetical protein